MSLEVPHPQEGKSPSKCFKQRSLGRYSKEAAPKVQGAVLAFLRGTGGGPAPGYEAQKDHPVFLKLLGAAAQHAYLAALRVGPLAGALPGYADHKAAYVLLQATVRGDPVPAVGPASLVLLARAFVGLSRDGR